SRPTRSHAAAASALAPAPPVSPHGQRFPFIATEEPGPGAARAGARARRAPAGGTRREPDPGRRAATGGVLAGPSVTHDLWRPRNAAAVRRCRPVLPDGSLRERRILAPGRRPRAHRPDDGAHAARTRAGDRRAGGRVARADAGARPIAALAAPARRWAIHRRR